MRISISLQPPSYSTLGQMLQTINSLECHALHVMYVLYVCVCYLAHCCGFSLLSIKANTHITLLSKLKVACELTDSNLACRLVTDSNDALNSAENKTSFKTCIDQN